MFEKTVVQIRSLLVYVTDSDWLKNDYSCAHYRLNLLSMQYYLLLFIIYLFAQKVQ